MEEYISKNRTPKISNVREINSISNFNYTDWTYYVQTKKGCGESERLAGEGVKLDMTNAFGMSSTCGTCIMTNRPKLECIYNGDNEYNPAIYQEYHVNMGPWQAESDEEETNRRSEERIRSIQQGKENEASSPQTTSVQVHEQPEQEEKRDPFVVKSFRSDVKQYKMRAGVSSTYKER